MSAPFEVAVIGGGFSGLAVVSNLQRRKPGVHIAWIAGSTPGFGLAYRTTDPRHLLNVRAERMSLWSQFADDFVHWLQRHHGDTYSMHDFVPRQVYAHYLESIERELPTTVTKLPIDAQAVRAGNGWRVDLTDGNTIEALHCVLATGNPPMRGFCARACANVVDDFWAWRLAPDWQLPSVHEDERVLIVGTGLSAVDAAASLIGAGFVGEIVAVSSSGRLPQLHVTALPAETADAYTPMRATPTALNYLISLRRVCRGRDWRPIIDGLRCHTVDLWNALDTRQQQRFMRHLWNRWNQHRHRLAPEASDLLNAHRRFTLHAGRVRSIDAEGALWRPRGSNCDQRLNAALVINCTGPAYASALLGSGVMRQLLDDGIVHRHRNGLGIEEPCASRLHAIGPILLGARLETTAVPDLRQQADAIAAVIVRDLGKLQ